jgi:hypothetical protein
MCLNWIPAGGGRNQWEIQTSFLCFHRGEFVEGLWGKAKVLEQHGHLELGHNQLVLG